MIHDLEQFAHLKSIPHPSSYLHSLDQAWYFAPWHHNFFHRYRHLPQSMYKSRSLEHPLIMTRLDTLDPLLGEEKLEDLDAVERLLR
jgi:hypothetical protein